MENGGNKKSAGRPPMPPILKKVPLCIKLPRWLVEWTGARPESRAVLIEEALCEKHGLKAPNDTNVDCCRIGGFANSGSVLISEGLSESARIALSKSEPKP